MPTANRSSDTVQMVCFSRELSDGLAELIAEKARVCGGGAFDIWEAICEAFGQPTEQYKGEPVAVLYADGSVLTKAECGEAFETCCKVETPLYLHPPTSDGFSAGDMADQGAKAFAVRDGEVEELRARLVERDTALTRILERCDAFIGDERDMRVQSIEAIREIAARAVAP